MELWTGAGRWRRQPPHHEGKRLEVWLEKIMILIEPGDTVFHRPTREQWWILATSGDRVSPAGWPECAARMDDCLLVEKATAVEREDAIQRGAKMRDSGDIRRIWSRQLLAKREAEQERLTVEALDRAGVA